LRGITRLAYLLLSEWRLWPEKIRMPKIVSSDYSYTGLRHILQAMRNGVKTTDFVLGHNLHATLFGNKSILPPWFPRRRMTVEKSSLLGPVRIRTSAVTSQGDEDSIGLFTGSFNPIQMAWYKGGIHLPEKMAALTRRRPDARETLGFRDNDPLSLPMPDVIEHDRESVDNELSDV
jgi:hypothetical protein